MGNKELKVDVFLTSVKNILKNVWEVSDFSMELNLDTALVYGVGMNSLDLSSIDYVSLIVGIESEFDITYDFEIPINTFNDLYDYIVKNSKREEWSSNVK